MMSPTVEDRVRPDPSDIAPANSPLGYREIALVVAGFIVLVAGQLLVTRSVSLITRQFWFDEMFTQLLVSDPSLGHALDALRNGVDSHPPALYLLLRILTLGGGFSNEASLRGLSLLFATIAVLGLYATLRRSFGPLASAAGCLAVWSHPLVLGQAFEARGYTAWLAAAVWFAYLLAICRESPRAGPRVLLAVVAVFLCTVHYFGIITCVLVVAGELAVRWHGSGRRFAGFGAATLGPVALAACLPILAGQRAAYTVHTWVEPASLYLAKDFVFTLLFPALLAAVPFAPWLSALVRPKVQSGSPTPAGLDFRSQAGMTALALLPFVLVAFSYAVQPVLIGRYGLPAVAALGPVVAWTMSRSNRGWVLVLCALFVLLGARELQRNASNNRSRDEESNELIEAVRTRTGTDIVVFEHAHPLFVVQRYAPDVAERCQLLDFREGEPPAAGRDVFARDLVRKHAEYYHTPPLVTWSRLQTLPRFYVVRDREKGDAGPLESSYPGFVVRRLEGDLYVLVKETAKRDD